MFGSAVAETAEVGTVCWNRLLVKRQLTGQTTSSSGLDAGEGPTMFFPLMKSSPTLSSLCERTKAALMILGPPMIKKEWNVSLALSLTLSRQRALNALNAPAAPLWAVRNRCAPYAAEI